MNDWRTLGYVPDSDDDEDGELFDVVLPAAFAKGGQTDASDPDIDPETNGEAVAGGKDFYDFPADEEEDAASTEVVKPPSKAIGNTTKGWKIAAPTLKAFNPTIPHQDPPASTSDKLDATLTQTTENLESPEIHTARRSARTKKFVQYGRVVKRKAAREVIKETSEEARAETGQDAVDVVSAISNSAQEDVTETSRDQTIHEPEPTYGVQLDPGNDALPLRPKANIVPQLFDSDNDEDLEEVGVVPTSSMRHVSPSTNRPSEYIEPLTQSDSYNSNSLATPPEEEHEHLEDSLDGLEIKSSRDVVTGDEAEDEPAQVEDLDVSYVANSQEQPNLNPNLDDLEVLDMVDTGNTPISSQRSEQDKPTHTPLPPIPSFVTSPSLPTPTPESDLRRTPFAIVVPQRPALSPERAITPTAPSTALVLDEEPEIFTTPHRLRHRQPIQLNPYLIEQERYRQTLKSRGVAPVRIAQREESSVNGDDDSQEAEYVAPIPRPPAETRPREVRLESEEDDEIMLNEHYNSATKRLHGKNLQVFGNAAKRRKVDLRQAESSPSAAITPARATLRDVRSAPTSSRFGRNPSTVSPSRNSSPRRGRRLSSTVSPNRQSSPTPDEPTHISDLSSSSSDDEQRIEKEMRRMKHKIRGVLPASFLKINQKPTAPPVDVATRRRNRDDSPTGISVPNQPGLARKRLRRRSKTPELIEIVPDGDISSAESAGEPMAVDRDQELFNAERDPAHRRFTADLTGSFEDNRVDMMLSRGPVNRNVLGSRRERSNKVGSKSAIASSSMRQPRIDHSMGKLAARGSRMPKTPRRQQRIGILDVSVHHSRGGSSVEPAFVRIAKRKARQRKDQGRSRPIGKVIHLEDNDSTVAAQAVLKSWRRGTVKTIKAPPTASVHERSAQDAAMPDAMFPIFESSASREPGTIGAARQFNASRPRQAAAASFGFQPLAGPSAPVAKQTSSRTRIQLKHRPLAIISNNQEYLRYQPRIQARETQYETVMRASSHAKNITRIIDQLVAKKLTRLQAAPQLHRLAPQKSKSDGIRGGQRQLGFPVVSSAAVDPIIDLTECSVPGVARPRLRKLPPRRLEVRASPELDVADNFHPVSNTVEIPIVIRDNGKGFTGLAHSGVRYTVDFGIFALREGTHFSMDGFIGSGELQKALNTSPARIGYGQNRRKIFSFTGMDMEWGSYGEEMISQLELAFERLLEPESHGVEVSAVECYIFMRNLVDYFAGALTFPDVVDLLPFARRVVSVVSKIQSRDVINPTVEQPKSRIHLQIQLFSLVLLLQLGKILVDYHTIKNALGLSYMIDQSRAAVISFLCRIGLNQLRGCYEEQQLQSYFHEGIKTELYVVEVWVVLIQIIEQEPNSESDFWLSVNDTLQLENVDTCLDIAAYELRWKILYTLLPLFGFKSGSQSVVHQTPDNWVLVKKLVAPIFKTYRDQLSERNQMRTNPYIRALYGRCYVLMTRWKWQNPDAVVPVLFDFFAKAGLQNLVLEEDRDSPAFLQGLNAETLIQVEDSDTCFHLLLKIVVIALRSLRASIRPKTVRDLVARLIPNHHRTCSKDVEMKLTDVTALRNNHDILTVLYYAATPIYRPHLDILRYLVDPDQSHSGACRINLRAWSNILIFQLTDSRNEEFIGPLMAWYSEIMQSILKQHQEMIQTTEDNICNKASGSIDFAAFNIIKSRIEENHKAFEEILVFGLSLLRHALKEVVNDVATSIMLIDSVSTANIIASASTLGDKCVLESLAIIRLYLTLSQSFALPVQPLQSEESQDYGWSGTDDLEAETEKKKAAEHFCNVIDDPLRRLLSNCFGSDDSRSELLLSNVIETWIQAADFLCVQQVKNWEQFIGDYGRDSWFTLRYTDKWRMYTPLFMAKALKHSDIAYESHRTIFISFWLTCLIERESLLKYQHEFSSVLLNKDISNPLFQNPPFELANGIYNITTSQFRDRRLSLISTILANMRKVHETARQHSAREGTTLQREYAEMLQKMMKTMRTNYEELQGFNQNDSRAPHSSAYVDFIHQVVELLQQHTVDIVPIDRFFTDSSSFPLPAQDPTYVAGRLKNYGLKLSSPRVYRQLSSFFQSVCERSAVDRQQVYLASQLTAAFGREAETGDQGRPTLRGFFMCAMLPAYFENALVSVGGAVLAVPLLEVVDMEMRGLRELVDSMSASVACHAVSMIAMVLDSIRKCVDGWIENPRSFSNLLITQNILSQMFRIVGICLPHVEDLSALHEIASAEHAFLCIEYFLDLAHYVQETVKGTHPLAPRFWSPGFEAPFSTLRAELAKEIGRTLRKDWIVSGEDLAIVRAGSRRSVDYKRLITKSAVEVQAELTNSMDSLMTIAAKSERMGNVVKRMKYEVWIVYHARELARRVKEFREEIRLRAERPVVVEEEESDREDEVGWSSDEEMVEI